MCQQNDTCIAELEVDFNFTYVHLTNVEQQFLIFPLAMRRNARSTLFLSGPRHYWWQRIGTSTCQLDCLISAMTRTTPAFRCTILQVCPSLGWLWHGWLKTQLPYHFTSTSPRASLIGETERNIQLWWKVTFSNRGKRVTENRVTATETCTIWLRCNNSECKITSLQAPLLVFVSGSLPQTKLDTCSIERLENPPLKWSQFSFMAGLK